MRRAKGSAFDREPLRDFLGPTTGSGDGAEWGDFRRADGQGRIGSRNDIGREGLEEALWLHITGDAVVASRARPSDAAMGFAWRRARDGLGGEEVHSGQEASMSGSLRRWRLESGGAECVVKPEWLPPMPI